MAHVALLPSLRRTGSGLLILEAALGLLVFGLALRLRLTNLDAYTGSFDEGIRAQQHLLMASGYRPFRDIFASQGPLSLDVFFPTYLLFGQTLGAARLAPALFSIAGILVSPGPPARVAGCWPAAWPACCCC